MDIVKIPNQYTFPIPVGFCIDWIHGSERKETVALQCPTCLRGFCLADHQIDNVGNVLPSVVCPFGCGFHVMMVIK